MMILVKQSRREWLTPSEEVPCMTTRISISAYDVAATDLLALAVAADQVGFDTLWLGEHIVLPLAYESEHPTTGDTEQDHHITGPIIGPGTELLDPWVELAAIAGLTNQLRLATGMYILPLRHPLLTARAGATLHEVSGGRFRLGIGAGWLQEEFHSLGVPFEGRGARVEETIEILRAAWAGGPFEHHGTLFSLTKVQVSPRRVDVPLVLGGNTPRALRRAAALGDAWFSSGTPSFDEAMRLRDAIHALRTRHGRREPFPCTFRIEGRDLALVERYRSEGVDEVVIWADQLWPPGSLEARRDAMARAGEVLGLVPRYG
jgi:probable F420-dependent oxidoreductase